MSRYHASYLSHSLSSPSLDDPNQVVAFANSAIAQIDGEILDLRRKRVPWLRMLNQLHSATRAFSQEILSTIFEAVSKSTNEYPYHHQSFGSFGPPPPDILQVLKLGAVCFQWRDVAWSTPRLWIDITTPKSITLGYIGLLNLKYKNAGGHPVHVCFTDFDSSDSLWREMISIVFQREADKLGSLRMPQNEHCFWPSIVSDFNTTSFSRLRSLHLSAIHLPIPPNFDFVFPYCPELHKLHLYGDSNWLAFKFPLSQITDLRLLDIRSSDSLELILQCRRLVKLHCEVFFDPVFEPAPQDAIDMTRLETIHWEGAIPYAFFTHVRCPALHQLECNFGLLPSSELYMQFFASASRLAILDTALYSVNINEILHLIPNIQTIRLQSIDGGKCVVEFLHSLTIVRNATHPLPLLKSLSIYDIRPPGPQMAPAITQMLESRWKLNYSGSRIGCGLEYFSLELDCYDVFEPISWTTAQKTTLKRLAVEGCGEMIIIINGVEVPWL